MTKTGTVSTRIGLRAKRAGRDFMPPSSTETSVKYDVERVANYVSRTASHVLTESKVAYDRGQRPRQRTEHKH